MDTSKNPSNYNNLTQYGSWIVIGVVLLAGGQFDSTAELSAAMAYLILVAVALWYGPAALANVNSFIGTKTTKAPANLNINTSGQKKQVA